MNHLFRLAASFLLLMTVAATATPAEADRVKKSFQLSMEKWTVTVRAATTPEARAKAWSARPDPAAAAKQMWEVIGPALRETWTLDPAAWFLSLTAGLHATQPNGKSSPTFIQETEAIYTAIETYHMKSAKLSPVCLALSACQDPRSLALLEKIQTKHSDKTVQGVAALATAMRLKFLGDDPALMSKRLTLLRKAIIDSADVVIGSSRRIVGARFVEDGVEDLVEGGDITVAKLAEDELYIIRFLTKGRIAPDLTGTDSGMRPLQLSNHKGKVIVLLFWNSGVEDVARVLGAATAMEKKFAGKPFAIIGVNNDTTENLREMQKQPDLVTFPNFTDPQNRLAREYRIGSWPLVYVLDGERKIRYAGQLGSFVDITVTALLDAPKPAAAK